MIIHRHISSLRNYLHLMRKKGLSIGFVPTMGALHEGHLKLMQASMESSDITVCSIFVNPNQFNDKKDFEKYPNRLGSDLDMLYNTGVQVVFIPFTDEIYPPSAPITDNYDLEGLDTRLEGKFRPGHFLGVCQVMDRLLHIVEADYLLMGQKDFQQCLVIKKLLKITGLPTQLSIFPTIREPEGLAMSTRNMRLSPDQKVQALNIYNCLIEIKSKIESEDFEQIKKLAVDRLTRNGFRVDYVEIAETESLFPVSQRNSAQPLVALVAAFLGDVRLIDNMLLQ